MDGHSFKSLLAKPKQDSWAGSTGALTALYKWANYYDPAFQSYSLRTKDWRYIRYENGKEELYHTASDPHEWHNLANLPEHAERLSHFRQRLRDRLPKPGRIPPQPTWQPKDSNNPNANAEAWKDKYFAKHTEADTNKDGKLTWPEYKAHRAKFDHEPAKADTP